MANRLVGSTEEELKQDAQSLTAILKPIQTAPLHTTDTKGSGAPQKINADAAMLNFISQINEQMANN